ncbi:hypothetical protein [Halomonas sp.]|uniref:hypothetical protein n=1 Tax=Halomonas sp. TaxID=1486246 RepID=UPI002622FCF2|nr:hypothetical protein [Halomonas sp.]
MPKVRHYADLAAIIAGLMWLVVYWSISLSTYLDNLEPTLAALLLLGSVVLVTFVHRPTRVLLRRYHVRKRRTEMWMHILALPLFIAFVLGVSFELIFTPLSGVQKLTLFNVVATAGWLVFIVTLVIKLCAHQIKQRRNGH